MVNETKLYFRDGTIREHIYTCDGCDQWHGRCMIWHSSGNKEYDATYEHGKRTGTATWWHSNGQLQSETTHAAPADISLLATWDELGRINRIINILDGKRHGISMTCKYDIDEMSISMYDGDMEHGESMVRSMLDETKISLHEYIIDSAPVCDLLGSPISDCEKFELQLSHGGKWLPPECFTGNGIGE